MTEPKNIGLTVKPHLTGKDEAVSQVLRILQTMNVSIFIDPKAMEGVECVRTFPSMHDCPKLDVMLVIGGDGTILRAMRELKDFSTPIISVNRGSVGFLAEISIDEAASMLPKLLDHEGQIEERSCLFVEVMRNGKSVFQSFALNEAVISQGTIARLLDLRTDVNNDPLAIFHADGLIIATPTGSTAYSLAAGGPVVHPRLSALILTPINPHSLTQKPVVIPGNSKVGVDVVLSDDPFGETRVSLTLDGQVYFELHKDDRIMLTTHSETVKFIRRSEDSFFHTLRTKLKWGERI